MHNANLMDMQRCVVCEYTIQSNVPSDGHMHRCAVCVSLVHTKQGAHVLHYHDVYTGTTQQHNKYICVQAQRRACWDRTVEPYGQTRDNVNMRCGVMGMGMWGKGYVVKHRVDVVLKALRCTLILKTPNYTPTNTLIHTRIHSYQGVMGGAVASTLRACGYPVSCWVRHPRSEKQGEQQQGAQQQGGQPEQDSEETVSRDGDAKLEGVRGREGVKVYVGKESLQEFVSQCDALICMLPLTPETHGEAYVIACMCLYVIAMCVLCCAVLWVAAGTSCIYVLWEQYE